MKKIFRKTLYIGAVAFLISFIVSCEEDFTNIGSNVISNTKFDISSLDIDVTLENSPLEKVKSDDISRQISQFLLGVYANSDYEKLEASIVSQIGIVSGLKIVDGTYGADTTVVTTIDTVFLKIPYQVTLQESTTPISYKIDSVFGDPTKPFNLNIYRSNTFMNAFDPTDPTKANSYDSNSVFEKTGSELNAEFNFPFIPSNTDTTMIIKRRLFDNTVATRDTLKIVNSANTAIPIPFARIPLKEDVIKQLFLDKLESSEFSSQEAFNDYFRGLIIEASGNEGSLLSLDFSNTAGSLSNSIEIYYTNTVLKSGNIVIDTITKNNSFPLTGFKTNLYKMDNRSYPVNNEVKIQGTAGSEGKIKLLDITKANELRARNWLINDATLTFYVNQSVDTTDIPTRLYLYKSYDLGATTLDTQIKDSYSEALFGGIQGFLQRDETGKKERYVFKLTDYISDVISGEINNFPDFKLKVFNETDTPLSTIDTIVNNYSWNHRGVTLFNNDIINGPKKPVLTIYYSEKK